MSSSRPAGHLPGLADLLRSRLRALLPLGLISIIGLSIYLFFRSVIRDTTLQQQHPRFRIDGLGPIGWPNVTREGALSYETTDPPTSATLDLKVYKPAELMSLPILHRTSQDPFHARNRFKLLRDSKSPWLTNTPTGVMLSNRLSRNRFPSADSPDPSRGSVPPPLPPWPSPEVLKEKPPSLREPIPTHLIAGLNTSYVWQDRHRIKEGTLPKVQWEGFDRPNWESPQDRINRRERQGWVRRGFQHVWEGYKARAWGHDELKPISGSFQDPFAGWGATLVDCLDTLLIMNLTLEYNYARTHVKAIDWAHTMDVNSMSEYGTSYTTSQPMISFFETVIRYMGGLISAYDLSGDQLMLERAEELAEWLVPSFGTSSGLPLLRYQMGLNPRGEQTGRVCIAEIGSLSLEFTRLSQLTSKDFYFDVVQKITDLLDSDRWSSSSRLGTLFPTHINPNAPQSLSGEYTFGAMADSYYEYLVIGDFSWGIFKPSLDHLTCFSGAMIGLGAQLLGRKEDLELALGHADACVWAYESTKTGVGPERMSIIEGEEHTRWQPVLYKGKKFRELKADPLPGARIQDGRYLGRPETIESVYYMWRITGDRQWQDRGWRMFTSWMEACATTDGIADLEEVNSWPPKLSDKQESFVLAETFKYYYLLFSEPELISLDEYVMNTEAHPFRLDRPRSSATAAGEEEDAARRRARFWRGPDAEIERKYHPPSTPLHQTGFGTFLQQWARVDIDELSDSQRELYRQVLGLQH